MRGLARPSAAGDKLGLTAYLAAAHVVVRPEGREHVFEQFMQQRGLQRRVVLVISHYMSLLPVIEGSDLIATVPRDLAEVCLRYADVRIVEVPLKAPVIAVRQFWHQRAHKDPAHIWLRGLLQGGFSAAGAKQARSLSRPGPQWPCRCAPGPRA